MDSNSEERVASIDRGYRFTPDGERLSHSPHAQFYAAVLEQLHDIRTRVFQSMPRECECAHEAVIAGRYPTKLAWDTALQVMTREEQLSLLCPKDVRDANANCAHATERFQPNPYADIITSLQQLRILDAETWGSRIFWLEHGISSVDNQIARRRFSLPILGEAARALQRPNVQRLLEVRERLLGILDAVIADAEGVALALSEVSGEPFLAISA